MDPSYLAEPLWVAHTRPAPGARVYVGGKQDGTLDAGDIDASSAYLNPRGLRGAASRAALNGQAVFYPSAWQVREMLSYDLVVLWPSRFTYVAERFRASARERRERFLDRTGVRYRILPERSAAGRTPIVRIPYFLESYLYDWGQEVAPRASVIGEVRVVPKQKEQLDALFQAGWNSRVTALVDRLLDPAGVPGASVSPFASFVVDTPDRVVLEAGAGAEEGIPRAARLLFRGLARVGRWPPSRTRASQRPLPSRAAVSGAAPPRVCLSPPRPLLGCVGLLFRASHYTRPSRMAPAAVHCRPSLAVKPAAGETPRRHRNEGARAGGRQAIAGTDGRASRVHTDVKAGGPLQCVRG